MATWQRHPIQLRCYSTGPNTKVVQGPNTCRPLRSTRAACGATCQLSSTRDKHGTGKWHAGLRLTPQTMSSLCFIMMPRGSWMAEAEQQNGEACCTPVACRFARHCDVNSARGLWNASICCLRKLQHSAWEPPSKLKCKFC